MYLQAIDDGTVSDLVIEITRKCNMKCGHCLRGDAQKDILDLKVIKQFILDNDIEDIGRLTITGGEPLLVPEKIEELTQMLHFLKVNLGSFYIATNGSSFTIEALWAIARLNFHCDEPEMSEVEISNSKWHEKERERLNLPSPEVFEEGFHSEVFKETFPELSDEIEATIGDMLDTVSISMDHRLYKQDAMISEGRFEVFGSSPLETDDTDMIYINALGNIILGTCDASYDSQDRLAIA